MTDTAKLKAVAEKAKDNFIPSFMVSTRDVLELIAALEAAENRNAELEARTLRVQLPPRASADKYVDEVFNNNDLAAIYNACRLECEVKIKNACAAAGINLETGGE
ncbi:hypothetical protein ACT5AM_001392 [Cronobacter malonaticus]